MNTPIDQLEAEHRIIEKVLRALRGLSDRMERGEVINPDALDRIMEFLVTFADRRHHHKEEKCLFPALVVRGVPQDQGPLGIILQEHSTSRALLSHLRRARNTRTDSEFVDLARTYVDLATEHIRKEDSVLYRVARTLLDDVSMRMLQAEFIQAERKLPGSYAKYEQEAEEIERVGQAFGFS